MTKRIFKKVSLRVADMFIEEKPKSTLLEKVRCIMGKMIIRHVNVENKRKLKEEVEWEAFMKEPQEQNTYNGFKCRPKWRKMK